MERIINKVNLENKHLEEELELLVNEEKEYNSILLEFDGYKKSNNIKIYDDSRTKMLSKSIAILISKIIGKDYREIKKETEFIYYMYSNIPKDDNIMAIINKIEDALDYFTIEELETLFSGGRVTFSFDSLKDSKEQSKIITEIAAELRAMVEITKFPIISTLELAKNNESDVFGALKLGIVKRVADTSVKGCMVITREDLDTLRMYATYIKEETSSLSALTKSDIKELRKKINSYKDIIDFLEKNKDKDEITNIPKSYKKLDDELKKELLRSIYLHNKNYNDSLLKEYDKTSADSVRKRQLLLKKHNLPTADEYMFYDIPLIDLENIIETLNKLDLLSDDDFKRLVELQSPEHLEFISAQQELGYITNSFIKSHKDLILDNNDNKSYNNLVFNLQKIKSKKITKSIINNSLEMLLVDSDIIDNNFHVIENYGYLVSINNSASCNFLAAKNLAKKLDTMIELGCENSLSEDLSLLEYDDEIYNRLLILKRLNIPFNSSKEVKSILENDKFIIQNSMLTEYLYDAKNSIELDDNSLTKEAFLQMLDTSSSESSTDKSYHFGDVVISKMKVIDELNSIEDDSIDISTQLNILTKNKILDGSDAVVIKSLLSGSSEKTSIQKIKN